MWIVVYGSVWEGLSFVGPFLEKEDAEKHCDGDKSDWNIVPLESPPDGTDGSLSELLDTCADTLDEVCNFICSEQILPCQEGDDLSERMTELAISCRTIQ